MASSSHILPRPMHSVQFGGILISNVSLYVGDLDHSVTDEQLFEIFSRVTRVTSVKVCRDRFTKLSLGYGYVNFHTHEEARGALEQLNFTPINGKPMRIMFSNRDPTFRKSGIANIFIKNLDPIIDNKTLHDIFIAFGPVLTCKVATDDNGQSKGHGFVQFEKEEDAQHAISSLNSMLVNGKKVFVGSFLHRQVRDQINGPPKFKNVYIKNLAETVTKEDLIERFGTCGEIDSAIVMVDADGKSRGFGFVGFRNPDDAVAAVERFNGSFFNDKVLYVGKAEKKAERRAQLKAKFEQVRNNQLEKLKLANLYVKNLEDVIDDDRLREIFRLFGNLGSCKVMRDTQGYSKGFGFVAFLSPEDAQRAVHELNGKIIGNKPLFISVAQRKEERKAKLQARFAQLRALSSRIPPTPLMPPVYHPSVPMETPKMYFGQGAPSFIPHQSTNNPFQHHPIRGFRPGIPPNYMMPFHPRRQQFGQRMGFRPGGPIPPQQFVRHNGHLGFPYVQNARNGVGTNGTRTTQMETMNSPSTPPATLTSVLASASPDQHHSILGGELYPLVEAIEQEHAAKVTGTEVLHLIESSYALKENVAKALEVYQSHDEASKASEQTA